MSSFKTKAVVIGPDGDKTLEPVGFGGRMNEKDFEDRVVADPDLLGEDLLVLGRQLSDFVEDKKRLDVLGIDSTGELVLIELKVDEDFGFTDLQALGYAGAYADRPTTHFAETLKRAAGPDGDPSIRENAGLDLGANLDAAKATITNFLELGDFDSGSPASRSESRSSPPGSRKES